MKKLVELHMLKYMPRDEEIVENLMLSARPELRKEIERQLLEVNIQKDSVEDDWDFMTNRMYLAEERLEEETKMWSGSTQPATEKSNKWCPLHETSGHDASECRGSGKGSAKVEKVESRRARAAKESAATRKAAGHAAVETTSSVTAQRIITTQGKRKVTNSTHGEDH